MPVKRIGRRDLWQLVGPTPASLPTDKMKEEMATNSLRNRFDAMKVGEVMAVSIDEYKYPTVRTYASELGMILGRSYTTTFSRATRCVIVTRKS